MAVRCSSAIHITVKIAADESSQLFDSLRLPFSAVSMHQQLESAGGRGKEILKKWRGTQGIKEKSERKVEKVTAALWGKNGCSRRKDGVYL